MILWEVTLALLSILLFYRSIFRSIQLPSTRNTELLSATGKRYNKLIYVVLDALRFDSLVPVDKEGGYHNRMTVMTDESINKRAFFSVAGIPTATTCRIVGLMTGAPNSKLDLISAFTNMQVNADNLPNRSEGRTCSFYGDQFWKYAFSALNKQENVICSFSKGDIERREDLLFEKMILRIKEEQDEFTFAHFISLDAFGHSYGTASPMMTATLDRFDGYVRQIYREMSEDSLLVVVSDHGVTDQGAHGGSSPRELASVCVLFTKDKLSRYAEACPQRFIERFYEVGDCNTEKDWVKAKEKYSMIHQDDIVVTISHLMGLPIPFNSYGNLIQSVVDDRTAWENLATFKERKLSSMSDKLREIREQAGNIWEYNIELSGILYSNMMDRSVVGAVVALLVGLYILIRIMRKAAPIWKSAHVLFTIFMVSHSYWSFASEDFFWIFTFLTENFTLSNVVGFYLYTRIPGREFYERDRIFFKYKQYLYSPGTTEYTLEILSLVLLFVVAKVFRITRNGCRVNYTALARINHNLPQILFGLAGFLLGLERNRDWNTAFLTSFLSVESFIAIHFRPLNALLINLVLNNLDARSSVSSKIAALSIVPFFCNFEHAIQSIDFGAFFVFSDDYEFVSVALSILGYLVLPRVFYTLKFEHSRGLSKKKSQQADHLFITINLISLYLCFASGWVMYNTLTFENFFLGRTIFITVYVIFDLIYHLFHLHSHKWVARILNY